MFVRAFAVKRGHVILGFFVSTTFGRIVEYFEWLKETNALSEYVMATAVHLLLIGKAILLDWPFTSDEC